MQPNASVAATGLGIRYIGKHCYAYSGRLEATTAGQTGLDFTTGSGFIVGEIQCNAYLQYDNVSLRQGAFKISFNDLPISELTASDANEDMPASVTQKVLIPPLTKVTVETTASSDDSDNYATLTLIGRVYGAE